MKFLKSISLWFAADARSAREYACAFFDKHYPNLKRIGCSSLKRDGIDVVVAVFYSEGMPSRPGPYKVFLVNPTLKKAIEIDLSAQPQYAIRGRK
jgi:hypothetical protein